MKKVLVAGSAVVDVVIHVDHLPKRGEDINVYGQDMSLGGCAYNVSDCLRHFQVPFIPFYPVGTGVYGDFVRARLKERGIVSAAPSPSSGNGCCYCLVEPDGERTFICYHGAEYRFEPGWFDTLDASGIDSVYICGLEVEEPTGTNMIGYLEKHPEFTVYFAPSARICSITKEKMDRLLALHPVLHLNEDEAARFTADRFGTAETAADAGDISSREEDLRLTAGRLTSLTQNTAIITLGSRGCYIAYPEGTGEYIPACRLPRDHGGDAIGAGDSHIGSIIALRKLGYSFSDAVRLANRVSAEVVCTDGALLSDEQFEKLELI